MAVTTTTAVAVTAKFMGTANNQFKATAEELAAVTTAMAAAMAMAMVTAKVMAKTIDQKLKR